MQGASTLLWPWQRLGGGPGLPWQRETGTRTRARPDAGTDSPDGPVDLPPREETARPLQVYIVEDSPFARALLAERIEKAGARLIGSSADAQAAIGDVFALQPDLILIDIRLASGSGFDVLKVLQIHSLAPAAMKIVLTHYADAEYRNCSNSLGADRFFDKSFETAEALELIGAVAAEGRQRVSPLL